MQLTLTSTQRQFVRSQGILLGRFLIGLLFFFSGIQIIVNGPENTTAMFVAMGLPFASLLVWPVLMLKLGAGGCLIAGFRVGIAATALIVFTLLATLIAHTNINDINLFKNLAIIGGLLYVLAYGAGEGWKV
jgi:putative oxidoreductase